jgi:hypothetical protein
MRIPSLVLEFLRLTLLDNELETFKKIRDEWWEVKKKYGREIIYSTRISR